MRRGLTTGWLFRSRQFLYPQRSDDADSSDPTAPGGRTEDPQACAAGSQSSISTSATLDTREDGAASLDANVARFKAVIAGLAPNAGAFYEHVREWRAVPPALARLPPLTGAVDGNESATLLMDRNKLERWLTTEIGRCLASDADESLSAETSAVDSELVEYIAGLLEHPDYCEPALLSLELHEFLGDQAAVRRSPMIMHRECHARTRP